MNLYGPAFPGEHCGPGMDLREYAMIQFVAAQMANPALSDWTDEEIVVDAKNMVAELEKSG